MAQVINTNILSLNAQRNLNNTSGALQTSLQRLSSGLRINSAKDDAAGLAISERFTTQIRGLNQAIRNANDGISLAQTGEAALQTVTDNLQRIRELAVQSVNATNSDTDRATLQQEVQQRLNEIDRIAGQTSFNGRNVLDGSFGNTLFQVGANVGETIALNLDASVRTASIGAVATAASVDLETLIAAATPDGSAATYTFAPTSFVGNDYRPTPAAATETAALGAFTEVTAGLDAGGANYTLTIGAVELTASIAATESLDAAGMAALFTEAKLTELNAAGFTINLGGTTPVAPADFADITALALPDLTIERADGGEIVVTESITGATVGGTGFADVVTVAANAPTPNSVTFTIGDPDGTTSLAVTVDSNITSAADLLNEITTAAGYDAANFTASIVDGNIVLTDSENVAASFAITGTNAALVTGNVVAGGTAAGTADSAVAQTLAVAADGLTFQFGDNTALSVAAGTYSTVTSFVNAINAALGSNATATLNADNVLSITSGQDITIVQTGVTDQDAAAATVFSSASVTASGNLGETSVATSGSANTAISRVDAALTTVSDLRSTFGAIQNRFESTIANLSTTSENLQASRSRILDADFAQETANLTRAQILQQAGISVLAQANAAPQSVLALLQ